MARLFGDIGLKLDHGPRLLCDSLQTIGLWTKELGATSHKTSSRRHPSSLAVIGSSEAKNRNRMSHFFHHIKVGLGVILSLLDGALFEDCSPFRFEAEFLGENKGHGR